LEYARPAGAGSSPGGGSNVEIDGGLVNGR